MGAPALEGVAGGRVANPSPLTALHNARVMSDIVLERVSKRYGAVRAVDGVSLRAESGKFLVLLGPSGCGKSTILRLIAGLEDPSEGRILIGGRDVTRLAPDKRKISMVFQSYALFPHLSVAENIVFGLKVRGLPKAERDARLARVAELVGLSEQIARKPSQLSGGQRQRVALARAVIAENRICLMDEPLSNLDAQLRHGMRVEIRALQQRLDMTVVYVTHDQIEAMSMADRIVLMREGRIEQEGTPEELVRAAGDDLRGTLHRHPRDESRRARGRTGRRGDPRLEGAGAARTRCGADARRATRARAAGGRRRRVRRSHERRVPRRRHDHHRSRRAGVGARPCGWPIAPLRRHAGATRLGP